MANFKIEELKESLGLDPNISLTSPVTSNSAKSEKGITPVGRKQGRTVEETKILIKKVLAEATEEMTRAEIFKGLERKNTPHLRNILSQMVDAGEVIEDVDLAPSLMMTRYWYRLPR